MLRVQTGQALPGMRLAMPILRPDTGLVLLREDFVLDRTTIARLENLEVRELWVAYPGAEQVRQFVSPTILMHQARAVEAAVGLFDEVHKDAHARLDYEPYQKAIRGLIEALVSDPVAASYITETGGVSGSLVRRSADVCFISLLLGLRLQGYLVAQRCRLRPHHAQNVVSLGLGAMLHDIGMTQLAAEVRERFEQTRDESDPAWREHVHLGHRMVTGTVDAPAAGVVLHHHQHFDGSGFPRHTDEHGREVGLRGQEIHVFARIVCVADHFDRLRKRSDGTVESRARVMKRMLQPPLSSRFDPVVLRTLPEVAPVYPPGSIVRLSDGQEAVVVDWDAQQPCRPTVQPMLGQQRTPAQSRGMAMPRLSSIDLRDRRDLHVVEHDGCDVSDDNFELGPGPVIEQAA